MYEALSYLWRRDVEVDAAERLLHSLQALSLAAAVSRLLRRSQFACYSVYFANLFTCFTTCCTACVTSTKVRASPPPPQPLLHWVRGAHFATCVTGTKVQILTQHILLLLIFQRIMLDRHYDVLSLLAVLNYKYWHISTKKLCAAFCSAAIRFLFLKY